MMPVGIARFAIPLLVSLVLACGRESPAAAWSVSDSAGAAIVVNVTPAWAPGGAWSIDLTPELDLTSLGAEHEYEFFRVTDVARFSDGRLAVADGGASSIRLYEASGAFIRELGRSGNGPGEFERLAHVWVVDPDTVVAFDVTGRIHRFLDSGSVLEDLRLDRRAVAYWDHLTRFSDGDFAGIAGWASTQFAPDAEGVFRLDAPVLLVGPASRSVDTLMTLPGTEIAQFGTPDRRWIGIPPLGKHLIVRAQRTDVLTGSADGLSYDRWNRAGTLLQRVRVEGVDLSGAAGLFESLLTDQLSAIEDDETRAWLDETWRKIPIPDERPGYSDLRVDTEGHVWVGEHRGPVFTYPPERWDVFRPDGRWLGSVETPPRFRVLNIGGDWVAGYYQDELDVHHVRLHRIVKPG